MAALGENLLMPAINLSAWTGSRHCWHCRRQLRAKPGGGYHFAVVKDPSGNELRLHKDCVEHVVGNGYVEVGKVSPRCDCQQGQCKQKDARDCVDWTKRKGGES